MEILKVKNSMYKIKNLLIMLIAVRTLHNEEFVNFKTGQ